jgi:hypothetical protein
MLERIDEKNVVFRIDYNQEVEFAILKREDGKFDLTWTDYIINVWTETFEDLSTAMLRAATLVKCGETNWESFFQATPEEFTKVANKFFDTTVTKPHSKSREETK